MQVQWRRIAREIDATAEGYVLAVSGGVDSMFMLDFFSRQCTRPYSVAHFNHGLRSEAADEARFVERAAAAHGVPFHLGIGDPDTMRSAPSLEAEARRQRYAFLESLLRPADRLVLGHHANDQLETVVMRLMRGAPHANLRMARMSGSRYRPFLDVPKETILRQAAWRKLDWMDDPSNGDLAHERNWVRHVLIPQMMERRNVLKSIAGADESFPDDGVAPGLNC